jgi:S-DNA-T family DNA segregation ATPase FtsK/SpoIIIE
MRFTLTVAGPASGPASGRAPVDVEVCSPTGATAAQLAAALADELGDELGADPGVLCFRGRVVPDATLIGHPPLVHGASLSLVPAGPQSGEKADAPAALELVVTAGPDAGRRLPLSSGRQLLGRGEGAELRVLDPALSRLHAVVSRDAAGVHITDLGSTNGVQIDGIPLSSPRARLAPGQTLAAGHSLFQIRSPGVRPASVQPDGCGLRLVNRAPRTVRGPEQVTITLPTRPEPRRTNRLPWLAMLLPFPVCGVLALLVGPQALLFALMTPVLMVGNAVGDRIAGRREYAGQLAEFERAAAAATASIAQACARERSQLAFTLPDAVTVQQVAACPGNRLWERRRGDPDFLTLRLGTGTIPSSVRVADPVRVQQPTTPALETAPVGIELDCVGVLGLAGPATPVMAILRSLVAQMATLHSPRDVQLVVLGSARDELVTPSWFPWLPHCSLVAAAGQEPGFSSALAALRAWSSRATTGPEPFFGNGRGLGPTSGVRRVVVLLGSRELRASPTVARLLAEAPSGQVRVIAIEQQRVDLPLECRAVVEVQPSGVAATLVPADGGPPLQFTPDGTSESWGQEVARSLAPLRDATPDVDGSNIPDSVRLPELLGPEVFDADRIAHRWKEGAASTRAVLGRGSVGTFTLDLATDGPHMLVGGTTGSGKSELLQTLVVSLALANRPVDLALVLLDYKGGSAFSRCGQLPHTAGVVTDLDGHMADRALASLRAELSHRERALARVGATDLDEYRRLRGPGDEALGRLVVVIDEFRALADELPDFLEGMVRLAAVGRSLGVHLVLATQRPAGVVSADIKANVNLRIALRVRDRADSEDVIEAADAAGIGEHLRGRAIARSGGGGLQTFQTAWLGAREPERETRLTVRRVSPLDGPGSPRRDGLDAVARRSHHRVAAGTEAAARGTNADAPGTTATDLERIVTALKGAAAATGCADPRRPWLPPLPDAVALGALRPADTVDLEGVVWGLADEPRAQRQPVFTWSPMTTATTGGHWVIGGTSGSGRTSALRTLAYAVAQGFGPDGAHLYAIDGSSGGLGPVSELPHTGAVVPRTDYPRVVRLLDRLSREVTRRQGLLAECGHASLDEWCAASAAGPSRQPSPPAYLVVLIDDWDVLIRESEERDHGQTADAFAALFREGEQVGLRAVATGDRTVLVGRTASWAAHRLVLRLADRTDAALVGLPRDAVPRHQPPGRAVVAGTGLEVQLAHLGDAPDAASAATAIRAFSRRLSLPVSTPPFRVAPMPRHITTAGLEQPAQGLAFAVGGQDCQTISLNLERHGRQVLIAGPARSGVSTTLRTLALGALDRGMDLAWVSSHRPGWLGRSVGGTRARWFAAEDAFALAEMCRQHGAVLVAVDDVDQLVDTPVESALQELRRVVDGTGHAIICGGNSAALAGQFRGIAVDVARSRLGVLLNPQSVTDGDLLGTRVPKGLPVQPGRGVFVCRGDVVEIQVAVPAVARAQQGGPGDLAS